MTTQEIAEGARDAVPPLGRRALTVGVWSSPILVATVLDIPICPIRIVYRTPCPGCGVTRATVAMLLGNWSLSLEMNPAAPLVVPIVVGLVAANVVLYLWKGETTWGGPWTQRLALVVGVVLAVVWAARYFGAFGGPLAI